MSDLLRVSTAGSVDDGKSTLIGRLLYDTRSIFQDQLEQIEGASRRLGEEEVNLALLTDGLRAEREQKITIDVAYRYFATPRRTFILADTPGHEQYTRNMVTGASTADLAIVLIDATKGVLTQSRRHAFIASLLGIPHMVVAVNKMDLVDWSAEVFERIRDDFTDFAARLTVPDVTFVPMSALRGDNVVHRSERMPWYEGGSLLHRMETVAAGTRHNTIDFRFPVQTVIRPHQDFRGLAGTVASGGVAAGDAVVVLPGGQRTTVTEVRTADGPLERAGAGDAVVVTVADDLDIARGDMLVRPRNLPEVSNTLEANLCWMHAEPLQLHHRYLLQHTTVRTPVFVRGLEYRFDVDTLHREPADTLELNEIGRVVLDATRPIFFDSYRVNIETGSFILIDPHTNATLAAGMIRGGETRLEADTPVSPNVTMPDEGVTRAEREARSGHGSAVIWFTGRPGAGKSTVARAVERALFDEGVDTMLLDGDAVRHGLCGDLGFSPGDRRENIRRVGEVARLFADNGRVVIAAFVSPYAVDRDRVRDRVGAERFVEVEITAPETVLIERDPKGLYAAFAQGSLTGLTGMDAPYERPADPALVIDTDRTTVEEAAARVIAAWRAR
ncbi:adenylyl-sulfate kinase [Gaopeijia maritima]|uniref:adenylyl-sulfate kinase n=1 Tax=Gaopeijia maritima TaxID=3119007 RepID=UPI00327A50A8